MALASETAVGPEAFFGFMGVAAAVVFCSKL